MAANPKPKSPPPSCALIPTREQEARDVDLVLEHVDPGEHHHDGEVGEGDRQPRNHHVVAALDDGRHQRQAHDDVGDGVAEREGVVEAVVGAGGAPELHPPVDDAPEARRLKMGGFGRAASVSRAGRGWSLSKWRANWCSSVLSRGGSFEV